MREANRFAGRHAPLFAVIVTIAFLILLLVVIAIGARLPGPYGLEAEGAIGRIAIASLAVAILSTFGWMGNRLGAAVQTSPATAILLALASVPPLAYALVVLARTRSTRRTRL